MRCDRFQRARPVWPAGKQDEWSQLVGLHAQWEHTQHGADTVLRVTAADYYRVWCNGMHVGFGPARTAHGHARLDEWRLDEALFEGVNHLAIEVLSYGIDSYSHAMQPPFVQAEVLTRGEVILATGGKDFSANSLPERVQKVERYSGQRAFAEAYRLREGSADWRTQGFAAGTIEACVLLDQPVLLQRGVPYPTFAKHVPQVVIESGPVVRRDPAPEVPRMSARNGVGPYRLGYPVEELDIDLTAAVTALEFRRGDASPVTGMPVALGSNAHALFDFGTIRVGFIAVRLRCDHPVRVFLSFDERNDRRPEQVNVLGVGAIALGLEPGRHDFESFEIYSLRFLRVVCLHGAVEVEQVYLREYANSGVDMAMPPCADPELSEIFVAGRETFRTNAVDLYTDCQSRERGAYPCDAWFTAQSERLLTGASCVERNFLENFLLPESFRTIPPGMLPHCYPSDRLQPGRYIPNWAMWLFIQLGDYVNRSGDRSLLELAEKRALALFDHLAGFCNEFGLLENLDGWVFVEHSAANDSTSGVSHPTNLVYAQALEACAAMFGRSAWHQQAAAVRAAVRQESWDGRWFADQSVRDEDGLLQRTAVRSETCQYHAFWFGIADPTQDGELWARLRDDWGPLGEGHRLCWGQAVGAWDDRYAAWRPGQTPPTELIPTNLFYGGMLRFELLARYGDTERLVRELKHVFLPQARQGGTLWEHFDHSNSCNHGFASRVCSLLDARYTCQ